ncbi:hypothetical protein pb186bvf_013304 [Paramecium bursaria]
MSESLQRQPSQLLVMTIQIDEKRTGRIDVFDGDDTELLARDFCIKYGVNQKIVPILIENINQNIEVALQEKTNMNQYLSQKQQQPRDSISSHSVTQPSPKRNRSAEQASVYDRLYKDAHNKKLKKQLVVQDSRMKQSQKSQHNEQEVNYGLILYQKGIKKKEEMLQKAESARKDQQNSQLIECTYQPKINEISKQIAKRSPEPVGDHLNKIAQQQQQKRENALNYKIELEQQSCSFHPQINKISQFIIEEKKKQSQITMPHYEQLYQIHDSKKHKLQQLDQNYFQQYYTFHPKIDTISDKIVQGVSFEERQQKYRYQSREKNQSVDENQLFKPKTGRPPEQRAPDLFKNLYEQAFKQEQTKQQKMSQSKEKLLSQSRTKANKKSDQLVSQNLENTLSKLFDQLDHDGDGQIDAIRIDISGVEQKILNIFKPLLLEMEDGQHILTKAEFIESSIRLVQTLTIPEKHELLKRQSRKSQPVEFSFQVQISYIFQPQINEKSQKIVASRRN